MHVSRVNTGDLTLYVEGKTILNQMRGGRMDDAAYAAMLVHTIIVCTDAVFPRSCNTLTGVFYRGWRIRRFLLTYQSRRVLDATSDHGAGMGAKRRRQRCSFAWRITSK